VKFWSLEKRVALSIFLRRLFLFGVCIEFLSMCSFCQRIAHGRLRSVPVIRYQIHSLVSRESLRYNIGMLEPEPFPDN
jgi:hypothetical protein